MLKTEILLVVLQEYWLSFINVLSRWNIISIHKSFALSVYLFVGLVMALDVFKHNGGQSGGATKGGTIILVSDGDERKRPFIEDVRGLVGYIFSETFPETKDDNHFGLH